MGRNRNLVFLSLFICSIVAVHVARSEATSTIDFAGDFLSASSSSCSGSIGECSDDEFGLEEFELDSESNRRILASRRYISYGALRRNSVPCSRRGASYYNCRRGAQANPYSRGCSRITRCRR